MLLTQRDAWKSLEQDAEMLKYSASTTSPKENRLVSTDHISLDYGCQRLNDNSMALLYDLASECKLRQATEALMTGQAIHPQAKPALHTALRSFDEAPIWVNNQNISALVLQEREKMRCITEAMRAGECRGFSGQVITDIVHIGIGGSGLGPSFCMDALRHLVTSTLRFHFVSDLDANAFSQVCSGLNPETTFFIVASKSFATEEVLLNARKAIAWLGQDQHLDKHFIAVTAQPKRAEALGIQNCLLIWDWVIGRFSVCSAINLISCIALGYDVFIEFLQGAHAMDKHFRTAALEENIPALLALLGLWNNNILKIHHHLLLTYSLSLRNLLPYIQQLDMESNGKSMDWDGRVVNYSTGPIVWGGSANHAQHSYYQLLCQGTHRVTADLVSVDSANNDLINQLCNAHKTVLVQGSPEEPDSLAYIPGQMPMNHLRLVDNSPASIGALLALYEHKIFSQSVFWNINPFNQPGVDSSKRMIARQALCTTSE
jgi:glucose-6-phosphate isomerase